MASKLSKALKDSKLFSLQTVDEGTINDVKQYHDSGSYVVNLILSGDLFKGYIGNKITALSGDSGTGKCVTGDTKLVIYVDPSLVGESGTKLNKLYEQYSKKEEKI